MSINKYKTHNNVNPQKNGISVVIPAYNQETRINAVLQEVIKQLSFYDESEVIVVDNGSTDKTCNNVKNFNNVKLIKELKYLKSPYSARNAGIKDSKYDKIILLDATCVPSESWLESGLKKLNEDNVDIVAGDIIFEFQKNNSASEIYDSLIHLDIEDSVKNGRAVTGNLFIKSYIFTKVGMFPEKIRSSGDVVWTKKATDAGYNLVFDKNAYVYYPSRSLIPLMKKRYRIGKGHAKNRDNTTSLLKLLKLFTNLVRPEKSKNIRKRIETRGELWMKDMIVKLWLVSYLVRNSYLTGKIIGIIENIARKISNRCKALFSR